MEANEAIDQGFWLRFWGVRGSIAAPGRQHAKYGGNTSCVEVRCGGRILIIDMGTGARPLGAALFPEAPLSATVLFSHYHWDHIGGIPFFGPFYDPRNRFDLYGEARGPKKLKAVLSGQMKYPYFPVGLSAFGAKIEYHTFCAGQAITLPGKDPAGKDRVTIKTAPMNHPQDSVSYRVEYRGKSLVYCSDNEHGEKVSKKLVKLIEGCDLLVYDAAYVDDEYHGRVGGGAKVGWGHSTWEEAIVAAKKWGVTNLYIFHHDPMHTDDKIDALLERFQGQFDGLRAAAEGLTVKLA